MLVVGARKTAIVVVLVSLFLLVSMSNIALASSNNWVELTRFTGSESTQTELFTFDYSEWRIITKYVPSIFAHHFIDMFDFTVTTYLQGEDVNHVHQIDTEHGRWTYYKNGTTVWTGMRTLTSDVINNVGKFYMKISADLIENYTIIVEQNTDSAPAFLSSDNWVEVANFTGGGSIFGAFPPFTVDHVKWRLRWEYVPTFDVGSQTDFDFWIIPEENRIEGQSNVEMAFASVNRPGEKNGTLYFPDLNGTFFIHTAPGSSEWTIIVEQNIDSIPEFPSWTILSLFLTASVVGILFRKKLMKTRTFVS